MTRFTTLNPLTIIEIIELLQLFNIRGKWLLLSDCLHFLNASWKCRFSISWKISFFMFHLVILKRNFGIYGFGYFRLIVFYIMVSDVLNLVARQIRHVFITALTDHSITGDIGCVDNLTFTWTSLNLEGKKYTRYNLNLNSIIPATT